MQITQKGASLCYNELMPKHLILVMSLLAAVVILAMLNFTTPEVVGPFGVLVFFTMFYVVTMGIVTAVVKLFVRAMGRQMGKKDYLYAAVIAFGPIMLMLAQSLGTMSPLTIALTVVFVFLTCFFISKKSTRA